MNRRRFHHRLAAAGALLVLAACSKTEPPSAPTAPAAAALTPREAFELAQTGHGFTVGVPMAANTVYVFFDTTCPHCAELWKASQPLLSKLKMVWMPIGLLRASSGPQGATILAAADPVAAMAENEASVLARGGGISASASLSDEVLAKVKTNTELFRKIGADSVPLIVYRNARTGSPGVHPGAVDSAGLAALVGL